MELEQLDLVTALLRLRDKLTELALKATVDGPEGCPWAEIADVMDRTARLCRGQVVLETH
ncbi:hypothetical protein ACFQV2_34595 [Actinokineospora soli]|uniref:Uncharacterized protein n=1 Tax=Actinokineospora soli TaxID=1048753 RepID=A0ABW2TXJ3_9PSEU